ncbi:MAG TPA: phage tail sheath C-terminal domain-containing protein [Pyrinomonadaceae bacterium]|jgi:hypothetical protein
MPVQVSFPGVYIQEVPSGVHTITGVSTSIAAFIGRASKGKMNKATRILSLADYARAFGDPHPNSDLANAVKLFFANGGTECFVVRIAKGPLAASVTLKSLQGANVLEAVAKAEGQWANTVRMEVDYNTPNPDETFNLRVILEEKNVAVSTENFSNLSMNPGSPRYAPNFVSQSSELITLKTAGTLVADSVDKTKSIAGFSLGRRPLGATGANVDTFLAPLINTALPSDSKSQFDISVNGSPFVTVKLAPWAPASTSVADIQNEIRTKIQSALNALSPAPTVDVTIPVSGSLTRILQITSTSGDVSKVTVRSAGSNDLAATLMLGVEQGGLEPTRWSNFRPAPTGAFLSLGGFTAGGGVNPGTFDLANLGTITELLQSDITGMTVDGVAIPLNAGAFNLVTTAGADRWLKSKPVPGSPHGDNDGVREKLKIIASAVSNTPGLAWRGETSNYHLSIIARSGTINQQPVITFTPAGAPATSLLGTFQVNVRQYTLGNGGTGAFSVAGTVGDDGAAPLEADYLGTLINQTGFFALEQVDLFNLMVIPADSEVTEATYLNLIGPASNYCAQRRAFLIVDAPPSWTSSTTKLSKVVNDTTLVDNDVRKKVVKINSAVFYPRLLYSDAGIIKPIGAGGAMAGLMARIDSSRGVWKAPAGTEADLRTITGLEVNLTDMENGVLNKVGVNCIRSFPSGFVSWGARTLDGADDFGSEWKYIPIRRTALFLEESLFRGTKWVVFEPNDEPLWAKIRLNLNAFMMSLFRQGAFQGSTPDKAFFVKCDGETTTQNDRNLGIVNIEVGFAPLKPAEFVIIKIQQIAGEL